LLVFGLKKEFSRIMNFHNKYELPLLSIYAKRQEV